MNLRVTLKGQIRDRWVEVARRPEFAGATVAVIINQLLLNYASKPTHHTTAPTKNSTVMTAEQEALSKKLSAILDGKE